MRPTVPRAVGLVRVSKVGARGDDLLSPDLQRTAISGYAEQRGMQVVEWVEALDESGSQSRSPWWRRLDQAVASIESHDLDAILVWKFSRAARHRRKWAVALDRVEAAGGVLESATEQVDTKTSTGRLARGMLAEMAAWEADVKSEQWKEVHASRLAKGLPTNGLPRFGYFYTRDGGYEIDPGQAGAVRAMYERVVQGDTFAQLATWLHEQGVTTNAGRPWTAANLRRFMDAGFAAGLIVSNGTHHPGAHEPILTPTGWAAYQRVRETTRRLPPRVRAPVHHLAGLMRCGLCGGPMCRNPQGSYVDGSRRYLFACCAFKFPPRTCTGTYASQRRVDAAVREFLTGVAGDLDRRAGALAEQKSRAGKMRVDAGRAAREISGLDEAIARLAVQAAQGLLPASAHALAVDDLIRQRDAAQERMIRAEQDVAYLSAPAPATARTILGSWDELADVDPKGLRDVLSALIARVEVHPPEGTSRRSVLRVIPRWSS